MNYHYVRPEFTAPYPGIHGISPEQLSAQLQLLGQAGEFVSQADIMATLADSTPLPERAFIITFDDGLAEQYIHALLVLQNLSIPAIFFPNTAPLANGDVSTVHKIHMMRAHTEPQEFSSLLHAALRERQVEKPAGDLQAQAVDHYKYDTRQVAEVKFLLNFVLDFAERDAIIEDLFAERFGYSRTGLIDELYMNQSQLRALARAGYLGSHSHEHIPLGVLAPAETAHQLSRSADLLTQWTGHAPRAISYPYGSQASCGAHTRYASAQAGYAFGFTMERAANTDLSDPLRLSRFDNNDMPGGKAARYPIDTLFEVVDTSQWWMHA